MGDHAFAYCMDRAFQRYYGPMERQPGHNTLHAIIRGRVQGVGFRNFVFKQAVALQLSGRVRNLPDGSVEVFANGDRAALDQLVEQLRRGPMFAKVKEASLEWDQPQTLYQGFEVSR